jgi:hypothetical protein
MAKAEALVAWGEEPTTLEGLGSVDPEQLARTTFANDMFMQFVDADDLRSAIECSVG